MTLSQAFAALDFCLICLNHVGCRSRGQFTSDCPKNAHILPIFRKEIDAILIAHNTARNKIAEGREGGLPQASQMMATVSRVLI